MFWCLVVSFVDYPSAAAHAFLIGAYFEMSSAVSKTSSAAPDPRRPAPNLRPASSLSSRTAPGILWGCCSAQYSDSRCSRTGAGCPPRPFSLFDLQLLGTERVGHCSIEYAPPVGMGTVRCLSLICCVQASADRSQCD